MNNHGSSSNLLAAASDLLEIASDLPPSGLLGTASRIDIRDVAIPFPPGRAFRPLTSAPTFPPRILREAPAIPSSLRLGPKFARRVPPLPGGGTGVDRRVRRRG